MHEIVVSTASEVRHMRKTLTRLRLPDYETDEFITGVLQFVGEIIFQTFGEGVIIRGCFEETVAEALFDTFRDSNFNDVIQDDQLMEWVRNVYYMVAPAIVEMSTGDGYIISGVGFARLFGDDAVYFYEETRLRR